MADTISLKDLQRWSIKGLLSVLDQGLFSGANFIASIIFARWLSPNDYGAFALVFTLYLLFTGFYIAFILEPMSVLGPSKYLKQLPQYLFVQLKLHGIMTCILGCITLLVGWLALGSGSEPLGVAFLGAGLSVPFMLLLWYVRRTFYILKQPTYALLTSVLYFLFLLLGLTVLYSMQLINSSTCFLALGAASLLSASVMVWQGRDLFYPERTAELPWTDLAKEQWLYGRWIAAAAILTFSANQVQIVFLAGFINLQTAGALDALQNFIAPMSQGMVAISTLMLPIVSYDFGQSNFKKLRHKILVVIVVLVLITLIYEVILLSFPTQLELFLYKGKYSNSNHLIPILGIIPILTGVTTGYSLALQAIQKPQFYLIYGIIVAPVGLITGILFTKYWGLTGAVLSLVVTSLVTLIIHLYLYQNWFLKPFRQGEIKHE